MVLHEGEWLGRQWSKRFYVAAQWAWPALEMAANRLRHGGQQCAVQRMADAKTRA